MFSSLPNPFSKTNLFLKYNKRFHKIRARVHVAKTHFHRCGRRRSRAKQFNEASQIPGRSPGRRGKERTMAQRGVSPSLRGSEGTAASHSARNALDCRAPVGLAMTADLFIGGG